MTESSSMRHYLPLGRCLVEVPYKYHHPAHKHKTVDWNMKRRPKDIDTIENQCIMENTPLPKIIMENND